MSALVIRPATANDAGLLAALAAQVWIDTYALDGINAVVADYTRANFTPERFRRDLADGGHRLLVAEQDGWLLGYIDLLLDSPCPEARGGQMEINTLYVIRHRHGKGVGSRLLDAAQAVGRERNALALWLRVWYRNASAIAFYTARGFANVGQTEFVLDGQAHLNWLMSLPLVAMP